MVDYGMAWTEQQFAQAQDLRRMGCTFHEIGKDVGKSEGSVRAVFYRLRHNPDYRPTGSGRGGRRLGTIKKPAPDTMISGVVMSIERGRIEAGLTMNELCIAAGYPVACWHRILMGTRLPTVRTLSDFAQTLGYELRLSLRKGARQ